MAYIGRLNNYERVSDILELMRARHRWGLKEFIEHMVTDEPMRPGVMNTRNWRVKGLHDALELDSVIIAIDQYKHESAKLAEIYRERLVKTIRNEIETLGNKPQGLHIFDSTKSISDIELTGLQSFVKEYAPSLCGLLSDLMQPSRANKSNKDYMGPITMISSIIAYARAPRTYNQLADSLGTYLRAMSVKRRVLAVLSCLGIIPTYPTINSIYTEFQENGKVTPLSGMTSSAYSDQPGR